MRELKDLSKGENRTFCIGGFVTADFNLICPGCEK
jgi:hypothetical protein